MPRYYDPELVEVLQRSNIQDIIKGVPVNVKPIPDCDIVGAMDSRIFGPMKKTARFMRFIPKRFMKVKLNDKSLPKLRAVFDGIKSSPIISVDIDKQTIMIPSFDQEPLALHIYKRNNAAHNIPILYFIHGGAFFAGSTAVVEDALKYLVELHDIIVASIDYRLAPEFPYPTAQKDVMAGLEYLHEYAVSYGGNQNQIFVGGDSAGGNLALYCSNYSSNIPIKGQIILYPTVNMGGIKDAYTAFNWDQYAIYRKHRHAIRLSISLFKESLHLLPQILQTTDLDTQALSPYIKINKTSPPTLILVGEHDFLTIETLAYARKLLQAGIETKTIMYRGLGHAFLDQIGNYPQSEDAVREIGAYISEMTFS